MGPACSPERVERALAEFGQGKKYSVYTLAAKTGFSHYSMDAAVRKLVAAGKIEVDHQLLTGGRPINVYRLAKPKVKTECKKAGPILFPQYRWGSTRLG